VITVINVLKLIINWWLFCDWWSVWFLVIYIFFHRNTSVVQLKHFGSEWQTF